MYNMLYNTFMGMYSLKTVVMLTHYTFSMHQLTYLIINSDFLNCFTTFGTNKCMYTIMVWHSKRVQ